jgi:molybdopterin molybdotransferase
VLGLPGNPASALVTFALFGMPLLRALQGDAAPVGPALTARLSAPRKRGSDRLEFVRARLVSSEGSLVAVADDNQASGAATSLATSEGLAFVPAGSQPIEAGALVEFLRWADA